MLNTDFTYSIPQDNIYAQAIASCLELCRSMVLRKNVSWVRNARHFHDRDAASANRFLQPQVFHLDMSHPAETSLR